MVKARAAILCLKMTKQTVGTLAVSLSFYALLFALSSLSWYLQAVTSTLCSSISSHVQVTVEDMEAYRMTKANDEDPLSKLSSDVLLDEDGKAT